MPLNGEHKHGGHEDRVGKKNKIYSTRCTGLRCTGLFSHGQTLTFSSMLRASSRQPFPTASSSVWRCFLPSRLPAWRDRGRNDSVARVASPAKACVRFGHPRRDHHADTGPAQQLARRQVDPHQHRDRTTCLNTCSSGVVPVAWWSCGSKLATSSANHSITSLSFALSGKAYSP